ncbi:MAG: hypothetical protein ACQESK_03520 [Bacteroidota bacterium]
MKKVNFKRMTNQLLAGVFGLALMGGILLSSQDAEAQEKPPKEIVNPNPGEGNPDCEGSTVPNTNCPIWVVKVEFIFTGPKFTCTTGGSYTCKTS